MPQLNNLICWICQQRRPWMSWQDLSLWDDDQWTTRAFRGAPFWKELNQNLWNSWKIKLWSYIPIYPNDIPMLLVKKTMKYVDQKWWKTINEPINDSSIYSQLTIEFPSTTNFVALTCTEPINVKKKHQKMCVYIYIYKKTINRVG